MGRHDSEIMNDGRSIEVAPGALGVVAVGRQGSGFGDLACLLACWRHVPDGTRSISAVKQANVCKVDVWTVFHAGDDALVNFTAWPQQIAKVPRKIGPAVIAATSSQHFRAAIGQ